jgi:hypothetical protein
MRAFWDRFWRDDSGFIISAELVIVLTIGVLGLVVGLSAVQSAVVFELNDLAMAFSFLNQTYFHHGFWGCRGTFVGGSGFVDMGLGRNCLGVGIAGGGMGGGFGTIVGGGIGGGGAYGPGYPGYGSPVVAGPRVIEQSSTVVTTPTPVPAPVAPPAPCDPCETDPALVTPPEPVPASPPALNPPAYRSPLPNVPRSVPPAAGRVQETEQTNAPVERERSDH